MKKNTGIRTAILEAMESMSSRAKKVSELDKLTILPSAFKYQEVYNIKKNSLEELLVNDYEMTKSNIDFGLDNLEKDGVLKIHQIKIADESEAANYITLTNDRPSSGPENLRELFKQKSGIK